MARNELLAELDGTTEFRIAIGRLIEARFEQMISYRDGTISGRDPEDLHKMRVWSRRLRAAMDVAGGCFPKQFRYYHRTIKDLTDVLGDVRDCDVMRESLLEYRSTRPKEEWPAVNQMLNDLRQQREQARTAMLAFFERLDRERFDVRFRGFVAEHTIG